MIRQWMAKARGRLSAAPWSLLLLGLAAFGPAPDMVFKLADGVTLPARIWSPPASMAPAGVILALHGFGDSRDAWELPAPVFASAGWFVVAPDQEGFGATADRAHWPGSETLIDDAAQMAAQLRARYPGRRLVIMGESMGGAVTMCLAARAPRTADAYVLVSPAVWGRAQMALSLRALLWAADRLAPNMWLTGNEVQLDITPTDNRAALIQLVRDPLTVKGSSVAMLNGLVDLMTKAQAAAPDLPASTLVLDGRKDQIVPQSAIAVAWRHMPGGVRRGFYLSGFHLLLRDTDRALVESDILAWLKNPRAWLASGADINAAAWMADHAWSAAAPQALPASAADGIGHWSTWPF